MTSEWVFRKHIFPYLDDVINWKVVLFLDERTVENLIEVGLIKKREPADKEVDSFIVCDGYKIQFHRYLYFISKIQKDDDVLYEYSEEKASEKRPKVGYLQFF